MKVQFIIVLQLLLLIIFISCSGPSVDYWPTNGWKVSSPEEQGMSSPELLQLLMHIQKQEFNINSLLIIKNGYIVLDTYFHPFREGQKHAIYSCTKSILSTLIGIALKKDYIKNTDQTVLEFFPEIEITENSQDKKEITLKDVLSMNSSIDDQNSYIDRWQNFDKMNNQKDWLNFILNLPLISASGTEFDYNNMTYFILSAIIRQTTGMSVSEFAEKELFIPLGITDIIWPENRYDMSLESFDVRMHPYDLAKIGFLYLNNGKWDEDRLLSESFVKESTKSQVFENSLKKYFGYQWWVDSKDVFMAIGYAGQYLIIDNPHKLIIVITGTLKEKDFSIPDKLYKQYIIKALTPGKEKKVNESALNALNTLQNKIQNPKANSIHQFPKKAIFVSEKLYLLNENKYNWQSFTLSFTKESLIIKQIINGKKLELEAGLDNIYRYTDTGNTTFAGKAAWLNNDTLSLNIKLIGEAWESDYLFSFSNNNVTIKVIELSGEEINIKGSSVFDW